MKAVKKEKASIKDSLAVVKRIVKDTRPIALELTIAGILSLLSIMLALSAPELVGELCNSIYLACVEGIPLTMSDFINKTILLAIIYIVSAISGVITMYIMNNAVSRHYSCRIRIDMSEKIAKIPIAKLDTVPNGEIISRMTNDVSVMGGSVHDIFNIFINGFIRLALISIIIFIQNPLMALALVFFVPLSMFLSARLAALSEKHFSKSREAAGKIYSITEESLTGFDTVKAFGIEKERQEAYERLAIDYKSKSELAYIVSGTIEPLVSFVSNFSYIIISVIGGILAINTTADVGDLVAFVLYSSLFAGPLESIATAMSSMQSTVASSKRVYEFLDDDEIDEKSRTGALSLCRGEVIFENISFCYTEDKPLIENFSLKVNPGDKVAIVGPTGGGKTTIVNLLMRFYDPQRGRILVDGYDIKLLSREDVRDAFGMVLQDTVLFSGSVFDNIAYGKAGATIDEVRAATRCAHIDQFIEGLPLGYESTINEDSTNISAGQKQLITIARAYLSNKPMLILDEATSNVDTRTELLIQKTMDELMQGRTSFVIAHRLSTIENADIILVIDKGHIVEMGTHRELLSKGGLYSKIHNSQYLKE